MLAKTGKHQYFFEANVKREEGCKGTIAARGVDEKISVATPAEFAGGVEGMWSPEQLFLSALSSCMMATYLAIAAKRNLIVKDFECSAIGLVQLVEGHLEFTSINLFPKVWVEQEEDIPLANEVLLKTYKHCIIANSIKSRLVHHSEVTVSKIVGQS